MASRTRSVTTAWGSVPPKDRLPMSLDRLPTVLLRGRDWASRHSRRLSLGFVALLGGFAAAAFGVGPLLPDPADQPQRLITQPVITPGMRDQLDALADHDLDLWRSDLTRATDNADKMRAGLAGRQRHRSAQLWDGLFAPPPSEPPATCPTRVAAGSKCWPRSAPRFSADIDFHRELRKGRHLQRGLRSPDRRRRAGDLGRRPPGACWRPSSSTPARPPGAVVHRRQRPRRLLRVRRPAAAAAPSWPARWSSRASRRASRCACHPILQTWRAHLGVDYGAPHGHAGAQSVGRRRGRVRRPAERLRQRRQVQHGGERSTLYAHLSRIDVRKGQRIEQGQRIGSVGATGWATGPHLHFEFRVNGAHQDPLGLAKRRRDRAGSTRVARALHRAGAQREAATRPGRRRRGPIHAGVTPPSSAQRLPQ
jgi:hypothetical protein